MLKMFVFSLTAFPSWIKVRMDFLLFRYYKVWQWNLGQGPTCKSVQILHLSKDLHSRIFSMKNPLISNYSFTLLCWMIGPYIESYFYQPSANRWQISMPLRTDTVISRKICQQCETCLMTSSMHSICHNFALLYDQSRARSHMVEVNNLALCPLQCQPDFSFQLQFALMTPALLPGFPAS